MQKRITYIIFGIFFLCFFCSDVFALESDRYYLPIYNGTYIRSQHTYSYFDLDGTHHQEFVPANYTLVKDLDEASQNFQWNFHEKYKVPWTVHDTSYNVAYCTDVLTSVVALEPYRKVRLVDSEFLDNSIKENLAGILNHTIPFISQEEMIGALLKENVLEKVNVNGKEFVTAKGNINVTRDITADELVSATQLAIYNYSNLKIIDKVYHNTVVLSTRTVLRQAGLWNNLYTSKGVYPEVDANIRAVYEYLIHQKDSLRKETTVDSVAFDKSNFDFELNREVEGGSQLKAEVYYKGDLIQSFDIDNSDNYSVDIDGMDVNEITIKTSGVENVPDDIYVFEGIMGKNATQTLLGISANMVEVSNEKKFQDLGILKNASVETAGVGEQFDYIIEISNSNAFAVGNVFVEEDIDENLKIISTDGNAVNQHVSWNLRLNANETKKLIVRVEVLKYTDENQAKNIASMSYGNVRKLSNEVIVKLTGNKDFIDNPDTGSFLSVPLILLFAAVSILFFYISKKYTKLFRMK